MKYLMLIAVLAALYGCGSAESASPAPAGIFIADSLAPDLGSRYESVQKCAELSGPSLSALRIEIMNYPIKCDQNDGKCLGLFTPPNTIYLASSTIFNHEVIHYLLYLNTGDPDHDHLSPLFGKCQT